MCVRERVCALPIFIANSDARQQQLFHLLQIDKHDGRVAEEELHDRADLGEAADEAGDEYQQP